VIAEVFVLALANAVRPTSLAAVYALIGHDQRRRLMLAYVIAGLAFTLAFGAVVVGATHGVHFRPGGEAKGVLDIAGGVAALAFGAGLATGRISRDHTDDAPVEGRMKSALDRRLTIRTAAVAGPATHIPGLFYLVALNAIIAHNVALADKTLALVTYNAVWFALPLAALVACIFRPSAARGLIGSVDEWTRENARTILLVASFVVGAALVVRGVLAL
jgi:hypothetical protein